MENIFFYNKPLNSILLNIYFKTWSSSDKKNWTAHLLEHLLISQLQWTEVLDLFYKKWWTINAITREEEFLIEIKILNNEINSLLNLLKELFKFTFTKELLEIEKNIILDEISTHQEGSTIFSYNKFKELFFWKIPLSMNIWWNHDSIEEINLNDINAFINENLYFHNIKFVFIWPVKWKEGEIVEKINQTPFLLKKNKIIKQKSLELKNKRKVYISDLNTNIWHFYYWFILPIKNKNDDLFIDLLNTYIWWQYSYKSILYNKIREKHFIYELNTSFEKFWNYFIFYIFCETSSKNTKNILKDIKVILKTIFTKKLNENEFLEIRQNLINEILLWSDNPDFLVNFIWSQVSSKDIFLTEKEYTKKINKLKLKDFNLFIKNLENIEFKLSIKDDF